MRCAYNNVGRCSQTFQDAPVIHSFDIPHVCLAFLMLGIWYAGIQMVVRQLLPANVFRTKLASIVMLIPSVYLAMATAIFVIDYGYERKSLWRAMLDTNRELNDIRLWIDNTRG